MKKVLNPVKKNKIINIINRKMKFIKTEVYDQLIDFDNCLRRYRNDLEEINMALYKNKNNDTEKHLLKSRQYEKMNVIIRYNKLAMYTKDDYINGLNECNYALNNLKKNKYPKTPNSLNNLKRTMYYY